MVSFLFLLIHFVYAGSYECSHYTSLNEPTRNIGHRGNVHKAIKKHCDGRFYQSNKWYRFIAPGNEMIPTSPPPTNQERCGTWLGGWQQYKNPKSLYDTTSGNICYTGHGNNACGRFVRNIKTTLCEGYYVYRIQWHSACNLRICTTSYEGVIPYQCGHYIELNEPTRNVNYRYPHKMGHSSKAHCDKSYESFKWYRFVAPGNEMVATFPVWKDQQRCSTKETGWQPYKNPTSIYGTTSGKFCYGGKHKNWRKANICGRFVRNCKTTLCNGYYVYNIEWHRGCNLRICTTSYAGPTMKPTASPTHLPSYIPTPTPTSANPTHLPSYTPTPTPTSASPTHLPSYTPTPTPTTSPTNPCTDKYEYCSLLASKGYCHAATASRAQVRRSCQLSCGTCFGMTISPSSQPSKAPTELTYQPTQSPPTDSPTQFPSSLPSSAPTCVDRYGYCKTISSFCDSNDAPTKVKMSHDCASTCGLCSPAPTEAPSPKCVDKYSYCDYGVSTGACYSQDLQARASFLHDCPVSCGTCYGETLIPTDAPSSMPTRQPTVAPTCMDLLAYCEYVKAKCNSSELAVQMKLKTECAHTCGVCTSQSTMLAK